MLLDCSNAVLSNLHPDLSSLRDMRLNKLTVLLHVTVDNNPTAIIKSIARHFALKLILS